MQVMERQWILTDYILEEANFLNLKKIFSIIETADNVTNFWGLMNCFKWYCLCQYIQQAKFLLKRDLLYDRFVLQLFPIIFYKKFK